MLRGRRRRIYPLPSSYNIVAETNCCDLCAYAVANVTVDVRRPRGYCLPGACCYLWAPQHL